MSQNAIKRIHLLRCQVLHEAANLHVLRQEALDYAAGVWNNRRDRAQVCEPGLRFLPGRTGMWGSMIVHNSPETSGLAMAAPACGIQEDADAVPLC